MLQRFNVQKIRICKKCSELRLEFARKVQKNSNLQTISNYNEDDAKNEI